jgi:hypothetical protein
MARTGFFFVHGAPCAAPGGVGVANVKPERTVISQNPAHLGKHLGQVLDVGVDGVLKADLAGDVVIAQRPLRRGCNTALETAFRQASEHSFRVAANQGGHTVIRCEEPLDAVLFRGVEALDPTVTGEKVRGG